MRTSDFDYFLPHELIAQEPQTPRDACKLLVLDRQTGKITHHKFFEITEYLHAGDVLVLNNTKVFRSRLLGNFQGNPKPSVEIFLLKPIKMSTDECIWEALGKPGHKLKFGTIIEFQEGLNGEIFKPASDGGLMQVRFECSYSDLMSKLESIGHIPVPPYIKKEPSTLEEYQTVYAAHTGSVAAPTAGFHFTSKLLERIQTLGVQIVEITLHVGIGTFRPVKTELVEEHIMHSEFVSVGEESSRVISTAKKENRRVIAVGTTVVRALEGLYALQHNGTELRTLRRLTEPDGASLRENSSRILPVLRKVFDSTECFLIIKKCTHK